MAKLSIFHGFLLIVSIGIIERASQLSCTATWAELYHGMVVEGYQADFERTCVPQTSTIQHARLARRLLHPLRAELIQLVTDLVRTNTVAIPPNGNETPGQFVLRRFLRKRGLRSELYETEFVTTSDSPWKHADRHYQDVRILSPGSRVRAEGAVCCSVDTWTRCPPAPSHGLRLRGRRDAQRPHLRFGNVRYESGSGCAGGCAVCIAGERQCDCAAI